MTAKKKSGKGKKATKVVPKKGAGKSAAKKGHAGAKDGAVVEAAAKAGREIVAGVEGPVKPQVRKVGRPSKYSVALAEKICREIAHGKTVGRVAEMAGMPCRDTIIDWAHDKAEFFDMYTRAMKTRALMHMDETIDIADDGRNDTYEGADGRMRTDHDVVRRSELRVDTRKFMAMKLLPRLFGEKLQVESGEGGLEVVVRTVLGQKDEKGGKG